MTDLQSYLDDHSMPEPNSGCILWVQGVDRHGYGKAWHKGKTWRANRLAYAAHHGMDSVKGTNVLHKCDNPACINPQHLFAGTLSDNVHDAVAKGRNARGENHNMNKLTIEQVLAIRNDQRVLRKIGDDYGVTAQAIWYIKKGRNWRHV